MEVKTQRIIDISDICELRHRSHLGCDNCIFFDKQKKMCPYWEKIVAYRASKKGKKDAHI
jgi:hypothetical protein